MFKAQKIPIASFLFPRTHDESARSDRLLARLLLWPLFALGVALLALSVLDASAAEERASFAFAHLDDGGCSAAAQTLELGYRLIGDDLEVDARVRSAPSGGDCRVDALSYAITAERRFDLNGAWAGLVKFGADERSAAAPYAITDAAGEVLTRPDGGPSDPVILPAGRTQTVTGIVGASYTFAAFGQAQVNVDLGWNLVPVDWADGTADRTAHAGVSILAALFGGQLDGSAGIDYGGGNGWHEVGLTWTRSFPASRWGVEVGWRYAGGLTSLDSGAPARQTFAGLPAAAIGPAKDAASAFTVGLSRRF